MSSARFRDLRSFSSGFSQQDAMVVTLSKRDLDPKKPWKAAAATVPENTPQPRRKRSRREEDDESVTSKVQRIRDDKATDADDAEREAGPSPGKPETPGNESEFVPPPDVAGLEAALWAELKHTSGPAAALCDVEGGGGRRATKQQQEGECGAPR